MSNNVKNTVRIITSDVFYVYFHYTRRRYHCIIPECNRSKKRKISSMTRIIVRSKRGVQKCTERETTLCQRTNDFAVRAGRRFHRGGGTGNERPETAPPALKRSTCNSANSPVSAAA